MHACNARGHACEIRAHPPHNERQAPQPTALPAAHSSGSDDRMAIIAQQFPSRCKRLLVVEDELAKAGLGWTGNYWAVALYTALQENRTLVEMPYATNRSRWCWRWPGTMAGCFTEPWTNCSWLATPDNGGSERGSELVVRRKLSQVAGSAHATLEIIYGELLGNASPLAAFRRTALQFLFGRPLPWVRAMGDCVIQRDGLLHGQFVTIFVRDSAEKRKEMKHRFAQPKVAAFLQMAEWLAAGAKGAANPQNPTSVLLQTSSASALEELVNSSGHLHFAFTDNRRSDHDDWGGWTGQAPDLETAVAMVNLYLGSLGGSIAGLASSSWTRFQADVMPTARPIVHLCCSCFAKGGSTKAIKTSNGIANVAVFATAAVRNQYERVAPPLADCAGYLWEVSSSPS